MLPLSDSPGPLAPHELAYVVYSNLGLMAVNLICLFTFVWTQHRRTVKYYDRSIRILEEEQGEWFVNFVIERELAKLLKHYTRAGADPEKTLDEHECEHDCECEDDECEGDDCDCECHEGADSDDEDSDDDDEDGDDEDGDDEDGDDEDGDDDDEDGEDGEGCDCDDDDCECQDAEDAECECDDDCEDCLCECHEDADEADEDDETDEDYIPNGGNKNYEIINETNKNYVILNETNKDNASLSGADEDKGPCKGCGADADCGKRWADADGNKCLRAHMDSWTYEGGVLVKRAMVAVDAPPPDAKMAEGGADSAEGMGKTRRG